MSIISTIHAEYNENVRRIMEKSKEIIISRWSGVGNVSKENWKDLISALCLVGYQVYADEDCITFPLGNEDEIREKNDS